MVFAFQLYFDFNDYHRENFKYISRLPWLNFDVSGCGGISGSKLWHKDAVRIKDNINCKFKTIYSRKNW